MDLPYPVNLIDIDDAETGDVITRDGEFLGTWHYNSSEFWFSFIPDGETEPAVDGVSVRELCYRISGWLKVRDGEISVP